MEEQQHIIETFSEMAPRYEKLMNFELNRFWGISYEGFISQFLEKLDTQAGDTILDIATGTAFIPSFLQRKQKPFKRIIGLDLTLQMLENAGRNLQKTENPDSISLVCASAHQIPFKPASIDRAICCLATHHMDAEKLLSNIYISLKPGGSAHIADAGGSSKWKIGIIRSLIKVLAFLYFLISENFSRAIAESTAIANIHTAQEWRMIAEGKGFSNIEVKEMRSKRFWAPNPVILNLKKPNEEIK